MDQPAKGSDAAVSHGHRTTVEAQHRLLLLSRSLNLSAATGRAVRG